MDDQMVHERLALRKTNPNKVHFFDNKEDIFPICGHDWAVLDDRYIWDGLEDRRCKNCLRILKCREEELPRS